MDGSYVFGARGPRVLRADSNYDIECRNVDGRWGRTLRDLARRGDDMTGRSNYVVSEVSFDGGHSYGCEGNYLRYVVVD